MKQKSSGKVSFLGGNATDHVAQITLTAADLTTLKTVPVTLIKAPTTANVAIQVTRAVFQFKYGGVAFTGGGAVSLVYHGATANLLSGSVAAATVTGTADSAVSLGAPAAATVLTPATGIDLLAATADFAAGNSTALVTVWYTMYKSVTP